MGELLAILTPIVVVDLLNPILLGVLVFAAASKKPLLNSTMMLSGHMLAYFVAGIAIAYGLDLAMDLLVAYWTNPPTIAFLLSIVVGVYCFYWALRPPASASGPDEPTWELTPARCFGFGVALSVLGAVFAVPYIAAIDQILKAQLSFGTSLAVLGAYNVVYGLPFLAVPLMVAIMGERAKPLLDRINGVVLNLVTRTMPWLIGLLGTWFVFDGVYFFIVGKPVI